MRTGLWALALFSCVTSTSQAQFQTVTIQDIQTVTAQDLAACVDDPQFLGDTLITRGTIVMDAGLAQVENGRNVWLQSGSGPYSGIELITTGVSVPLPGIDVLDLLAGDSVAVTGIVSAFNSETAILPISIDLIDAGRPIALQAIQLADLNDATSINNLVSGEQWEGVYVELDNVTVVSVNSFSDTGVDRVHFTVRDAAGNLVTVADRFLAQRLPGAGGNFFAPSIGTVYANLRGVIAHAGNGCTGGSGNGYELFVFDANDFVLGSGGQAPQIATPQRSSVTPTSADDLAISAQITDADGTVTSASVYYAVGAANASFIELPMSNSVANTFEAAIPASAYTDGDLVKFYVCATDDSALSACNPNVPGGVNPVFLRVRDDGLTIPDVQFTPYSDGRSGYEDFVVELTGVVTGSAEPGNLGAVYVQHPEGTAWAGLGVAPALGLDALRVGDLVELTGRVQENFGFTRLTDVSTVNVVSSGNPVPAPVVVDPVVFTDYDFGQNEQYEGMLVRLENPGSEPLFVVDVNPDAPNNFAEYRVGTSTSAPGVGMRVLAGRQTSSVTSSLSFPYINDEMWITNSGTIDTGQIDVCVVTAGDFLSSLTGIVYYGSSSMKLLPRNTDDATDYTGANCPGNVGVEEESAQLVSLAAYPNPVATSLRVDYSFVSPVRAVATLYDVVGRSVGSLELSGANGTASFDTSSLSVGTYLLVVNGDNGALEFRKVVVLR